MKSSRRDTGRLIALTPSGNLLHSRCGARLGDLPGALSGSEAGNRVVALGIVASIGIDPRHVLSVLHDRPAVRCRSRMAE